MSSNKNNNNNSNMENSSNNNNDGHSNNNLSEKKRIKLTCNKAPNDNNAIPQMDTIDNCNYKMNLSTCNSISDKTKSERIGKGFNVCNGNIGNMNHNSNNNDSDSYSNSKTPNSSSVRATNHHSQSNNIQTNKTNIRVNHTNKSDDHNNSYTRRGKQRHSKPGGVAGCNNIESFTLSHASNNSNVNHQHLNTQTRAKTLPKIPAQVPLTTTPSSKNTFDPRNHQYSRRDYHDSSDSLMFSTGRGNFRLKKGAARGGRWNKRGEKGGGGRGGGGATLFNDEVGRDNAMDPYRSHNGVSKKIGDFVKASGDIYAMQNSMIDAKDSGNVSSGERDRAIYIFSGPSHMEWGSKSSVQRAGKSIHFMNVEQQNLHNHRLRMRSKTTMVDSSSSTGRLTRPLRASPSNDSRELLPGSEIKVKITQGPSDVDFLVKQESAGKFDDFTAQLAPLPLKPTTITESLRVKDQRGYLSKWRSLSKTKATSYKDDLDVTSFMRQQFQQDRRQVFATQRIPTLRTSPAHIVWPAPPLSRSHPHLHSASFSASPSTVHAAPVPASAPATPLAESGGASPMNSPSAHFKGVLSTSSPISDPGTKHDRITRLSVPSGSYKSSGASSRLDRAWWRNRKLDSVRIDLHNHGLPRFYPWAPYDHAKVNLVRCWIMREARLHNRLRVPTQRELVQKIAAPVTEDKDGAAEDKKHLLSSANTPTASITAFIKVAPSFSMLSKKMTGKAKSSGTTHNLK